jgi:PilZ domain
MPKPINHIKREVRRARRISAWIRVQDRTIAECHVMDISKNGAKLVATTSSLIPDRFQLAFTERGEIRSCEVIWRHGKIFGVKFAP